MNAELL